MLIVALVCMIGVTIAPSCNEGNLRKAIDASYRLPAATNDLTNKIRAGRDAGIIKPDDAAQFGRWLEQMAKAEQVFAGMVKAAQTIVDRGDKVPELTFVELRNYFDLEIVEPFLQVLGKAGLLSGPDISIVIAGITAARLLIVTIGRGIGSKKPIPTVAEVINSANASQWRIA